jgi:hypothetical protein
MALGRRWKRKFGVPFILDIQDPWRNDFYLDKPKSQRPPKFFIAYNIDKYLERRTVPEADGIISVSRGYCDTFMQRYPSLKQEQFRVIPFGAAALDFEIMQRYVSGTSRVQLPEDKINIVYIGRGGHDMQFALEIIFGAFKKGLEKDPAGFSRVHFWFIGTSYAPAGQGQQTIVPIARMYQVDSHVTEVSDRIPYFDTLFLLKKADILLMPGSTDTNYTASKIYPYILAEKPLLAVFHQQSSVVNVLREVGSGGLVVFKAEGENPDHYSEECRGILSRFLSGAALSGASLSGAASSGAASSGVASSGAAGDGRYDRTAFEPYTARAMTLNQVNFFNQTLLT